MSKTVLVTGASGFIASHTIIELLQHGYAVRGTVRDLARVDGLRAMLIRHHPAAADIEFLECDLNGPDGWEAATRDCDAVFHIASPVPVVQPRDAAEVIEPAKNGTRFVLEAAAAVGVTRIVLTSSVAAVMGAERIKEKTFTATDWSDPAHPDLTPYAQSKTIAERTAWALAREHQLELTTINPALVLGPACERDYGSSLEALIKVLRGEVPLLPRFGFEIVDVRDVASLHRLALENDNAIGQRLLCGAGFRWFAGMAATLREHYPENRRIPTRTMPDWLTRMAALFVPEIGSFVNDLSARKELDCSPARQLGWQPRSPEEAIIAGAESLIELGLV